MADDLLLLTDPRLLAHDPGAEHPERPLRLEAILGRFEAAPIVGARWAAPAPAPREALLRVHNAAHLAALDGLRGEARMVTPDTAVSADSLAAIYLAAGSGIAAVDALLGGDARRALCLVRPPGHHAKRGRVMGFCFVNNVAVAAAHARARGVDRVMIVDWDVHHGNGTEEAFFGDPRVLVVDSHQTPLYPGTGEMDSLGEGAGRGFTVNLPLPAGVGDGDLVALYRALLPALVESFEPGLILVSAGFDGARGDPIGGFDLTPPGFAALTGLVCELADRHCEGRLALLLEGGYDPESLAASVHACAEVLAGAPPPPVPPVSPRMAALIEIFRGHHGSYWPALRGAAAT